MLKWIKTLKEDWLYWTVIGILIFAIFYVSGCSTPRKKGILIIESSSTNLHTISPRIAGVICSVCKGSNTRSSTTSVTIYSHLTHCNTCGTVHIVTRKEGKDVSAGGGVKKDFQQEALEGL